MKIVPTPLRYSNSGNSGGVVSFVEKYPRDGNLFHTSDGIVFLMSPKKLLFMKNITGKVSIEINAPAAKVWDALTNPELVKQYFFGTRMTTTWTVGDSIRFEGEFEGKPYFDKGTVLEFNPYKTIRYTYWSSVSGIEDKPENYVPITYSLSEYKDLTLLTVTQENIPDEKMKDHSEQNWKKVVAGLKSMVETQVEPAY